jgi:hypothetical protein
MFYGCDSLRHIDIPQSVQTIEHHAFSGAGLKEIHLPDHLTSIGNYAFHSCGGLKSITIPGEVRFIGDGTFGDCEYLEEVVLPESLETLSRSAFSTCRHLQRVNIPSSLKTISSNTFHNCIRLTQIELPASITEIQYDAFSNCRALTSIRLPKALATLGRSAFNGCEGLQSVTCLNETPPTDADESTFSQVDKEKCILYVPHESALLYRSHAAFKDFQHIVEADVAGIGENKIKDDSQIVSETYTDLLGRPVKSDVKGMVLKITRYANGEQKMTKLYREH